VRPAREADSLYLHLEFAGGSLDAVLAVALSLLCVVLGPLGVDRPTGLRGVVAEPRHHLIVIPVPTSVALAEDLAHSPVGVAHDAESGYLRGRAGVDLNEALLERVGQREILDSGRVLLL